MLQQYLPLLLSLQVLEEEGETVTSLQGATTSLLCHQVSGHILLAVGSPGPTLHSLLQFLVSSVQRLCGPCPDQVRSPGVAAALRCLVAHWRERRGELAALSRSLEVRVLGLGERARLEARAASWLEARRRARLPVHLVILDTSARLLSSSPSLPLASVRFLQLHLAARLQDTEMGEDGALREEKNSLQEERGELLYLQVREFPYTPVVVVVSRREGCVVVTLSEVGGRGEAALLTLSSLCQAGSRDSGREAAYVTEIQRNIDLFRKDNRVKGINTEFERVSKELKGLQSSSPILQLKLRQLHDRSLQVFSELTQLAFSSFLESKHFSLCCFKLELSLDLNPGISELEDLRRRNPSLSMLFIHNTTSDKSFSHHFGREKALPSGAVAEFPESRVLLARKVSLTREYGGVTVYYLRLLVDRLGQVQGEPGRRGAGEEELHRVDIVAVFRGGGEGGPDLGRVTLALAGIYPSFCHKLLS